MFSYNFIIRAEKNNALRLRFTNNRKCVELSLGLSMTPAELTVALSGRRCSGLSPRGALVRDWAARMELLKCDLLSHGRSSIDVYELREMARLELLGAPAEPPEKKNRTLFAPFFTSFMEGVANRSYRASFASTLRLMEEYDRNLGALEFDGVSFRWLTEFDGWLTRRGLRRNSRMVAFRNIRTVLNRAIDYELTTNYPFRRFKLRQEETRKRNLKVEALRRLFDYDAEDYQRFYIDYFKLVFMLIGINAVDLHALKEISPDGYVEYRRAKTGRLYRVKVEPEAMEIIERHRGEKGLLDIADRWKDHRDFTKNINIALKSIGPVKRVGLGGRKVINPEWPELTLYWARHSWATIAYNDLDVPKDVISQALGHASDGLSVTETYLDRDRAKVDLANRRVIDWVLYGRR